MFEIDHKMERKIYIYKRPVSQQNLFSLTEMMVLPENAHEELV